MTSSTTTRRDSWRTPADDSRASDHEDADREDAGWPEDAESSHDLDSPTTVIAESGLDEDPAELTSVVSPSGLDDNPAELTTVVSPSGLDDDEDSASPAVWRESDAATGPDEEQGRRIRIAGYSLRPWPLVLTGAAAVLVIAVAAILGSAGGNQDDTREPTPQPAVEAPASPSADPAADADTATSGDDAQLSHTDAPPVDPAHDPALRDPTSTDPDLNAARPPAVPTPPASNALPQGPLPANQLPGGPPLPYGSSVAPTSDAPWDPALSDRSFNYPAYNGAQQRQPGVSADGAPSAPAARGPEPRPYDRGRYQPDRRDRDTISGRLGAVTGLSRDSDRDYYRPDDRYRGYSDDPYRGRDSYNGGDSYSADGDYDRGERGPYNRRYDRDYDRDDRGLTGALGGL